MADLTLEYAAGSYCIFPTSDSTSLLPSASFPGAGILEGLALGKEGRNSEGEQVRRAQYQEQLQLVRSLLHVGEVVLLPITLYGAHGQLSKVHGPREGWVGLLGCEENPLREAQNAKKATATAGCSLCAQGGLACCFLQFSHQPKE